MYSSKNIIEPVYRHNFICDYCPKTSHTEDEAKNHYYNTHFQFEFERVNDETYLVNITNPELLNRFCWKIKDQTPGGCGIAGIPWRGAGWYIISIGKDWRTDGNIVVSELYHTYIEDLKDEIRTKAEYIRVIKNRVKRTKNV
jgi:hypothetical protein